MNEGASYWMTITKMKRSNSVLRPHWPHSRTTLNRRYFTEKWKNREQLRKLDLIYVKVRFVPRKLRSRYNQAKHRSCSKVLSVEHVLRFLVHHRMQSCSLQVKFSELLAKSWKHTQAWLHSWKKSQEKVSFRIGFALKCQGVCFTGEGRFLHAYYGGVWQVFAWNVLLRLRLSNTVE